METGRDLSESALGWCRVKRRDIDEVNLMHAETLAAAKNLGDIESRLEVIQYKDHLLTAGCSRCIFLTLLGITPQHLLVVVATLLFRELAFVRHVALSRSEDRSCSTVEQNSNHEIHEKHER